MSEPAEAVFPSRVDLWLVALLVVALGGAAVGVAHDLRADPAAAWPGALAFAGVLLLVLLVAVPIRYSVTESELVIRSGVLRTVIPLAAIRRVYPTRNPLAGPAWSLDRLAVEHRKGRVGSLALISPRPREEFLRLLAERAGLRRMGAELRREPAA